ncbi:MAG TPA: hypothetical protein VFX22_02660 [Candidatus Kapabacteria bacterium]|nr:hypothetical protein [Candidatus Kapabacteria bacterium]
MTCRFDLIAFIPGNRFWPWGKSASLIAGNLGIIAHPSLHSRMARVDNPKPDQSGKSILPLQNRLA